MRLTPILLVSLVLLTAGCDEPQGGPAAGTSVSTGSAPPPPPPPPGSADDAPPPPPGAGSEQPAADAQGAEDNAEGYEREVASVGMGKQGRNYGGGVISEPIRQYFRAGQRIQLIQMEQTMRHFKALNDRNPSSHEEFMEEIIKKGGVQLPELPPGERYVYDPKTGELMVERPKR